MRNLILILGMAAIMLSCVSVNPATKNYPVTGDILEAWIGEIPYEFIDERQYFRSAGENGVVIKGLWIDKDKKGEWHVIYNLEESYDPNSPPTSTAKFAPLGTIKYVERPFRK